jgi:ABC-type transport system involved in multi-copper enzyme maturation permease subunit
MNAFPIIHRELLVLSRRRAFYWWRTGVGAAIALATGIVLTVTWNAATYQGLGEPLFYTVTVMSYLVCLLAGPVLLADSVAGEKSAGTLALLYLTHARSPDIVGGKFVALAMPAVHCLLAAVPVMGLAFFLGGVTGAEFFRTAVALANLLFFSLVATLLCSVVAPNGRIAFGTALLIVLGCGATLPALVMANAGSNFGQFWPVRALASPALALWSAREAVLTTSPSAYAAALTTSQVLGWLFLAGAMGAFPFCWQTDPSAPKRTARFQRKPGRTIGRSQNPLEQMAKHRLGGTLAAWLLALATAIVITLMWRSAQAALVSGIAVAFTAYAAHGVFKVWVAWVASRAFAAERDSGALELLLVTPLGETAVWRAWLRGLRQRFLMPALALVGFDLLLAWIVSVHASDGVMEMRPFFLTLLAATVFLFDCYTLSWTGLWSGLAARSPTRACIRTMMGVLVVPGAFFLNTLFAAAVTGMLDDELLTGLVLAWAALSILADLLLAGIAMVRLSHDCREAAIRQAV